MTNIAEFFGEDLDPIEDVRRCFESVYTDDYLHPMNGDYISDDYLQIIDLTTQPGRLPSEKIGELNRSIERLNGKFFRIEHHLGAHGLMGAYISVLEQINAINEPDHHCGDYIAVLQTTTRE